MMILSEALSAFTLAARANGLERTTIKWYAGIVRRMIQALQDKDVFSVTREDMRNYIAQLRDAKTRYVAAAQKPAQSGGYTSASLKSYITALHSFWAWASEEYECPNPMHGIKRPRRPNSEPRAITADDFIKLFNACGFDRAGLRNRAMLAVLADTGCRLAGLLSMTMESIDLVKRRAVVIEKGRKKRAVFFTRYTTVLLKHWLYERRSRSTAVWVSLTTDKPLTDSGVHQVLKRLKAQAGVKGRVNPHSFRHRFAREYIERGGDISVLAKILGHTNINTTAKYYAVFDEDELAALHDRFTPMRGVGLPGKQQHKESKKSS